MSKRTTLLRYNLIIRKLRNNPVSFEELAKFLEMESDIQGYNFNISKRTFQRDVNDIRSIFNIDIEYDYGNKVYRISEEGEPEISERISEAFDILNLLTVTQNLTEFIHLESRQAKGTNNLYGLIHAIKNEFKISFVYKKFSDKETEVRKICPYGLKEFRNIWYVVGYESSAKPLRTFALDRLSELAILNEKFKKPSDFNIHKLFQNNFGVITTEKNNAEEIILSFTNIQGKYVKALTLHPSQKILIDNEKELRISLNIVITYDFIMELLSMGANVKVIQPEHLKQTIINAHKNALNKYLNEK
jgi:predicted DNA-binding transcriptional regulator YafY